MNNSELRYVNPEVRITKQGRITGYAVRYNSDSRYIPGVGIERVLFGACDRSLEAAEAGEQDLTLNCSHNEMFTLGSVALRTLQLSSDTKGLHFEATPPNAEYAKAAVTAVKEGRLNKCSFSFIPIKERRSLADGARELQDITLQHLTICAPNLAAYPATAAEARSVGLYESCTSVMIAGIPLADIPYDRLSALDRELEDAALDVAFRRVRGESRIYASVSEVPKYVPEDKRKQWLDIWNGTYKAAKAKGMSNKDAEGKAFAEASGVIRKETVTN
jgi:HK97 family phage prohead protease